MLKKLILILSCLFLNFKINVPKKEFNIPEETIYISDEDFLSENDIVLLSKLLYAECSLCDYSEQRLIINVVLNRLENDKFPNNIRKVIMQRNQFADLGNNQFYKDYKHIVKKIIRQNRIYNIHYFYNPKSATDSNFINWVQNKKTIKKQYHIFA